MQAPHPGLSHILQGVIMRPILFLSTVEAAQRSKASKFAPQSTSAAINEQAFSSLDAPITRLAPPDIPIPYNLKLMDAVIPSVALIRNEIEKLLRY